MVTRGWNGYRNKSQHRKSTLEKKILPPFQQGFEPATFQSRVRRSNHWAIPAPLLFGLCMYIYIYTAHVAIGLAVLVMHVTLLMTGWRHGSINYDDVVVVVATCAVVWHKLKLKVERGGRWGVGAVVVVIRFECLVNHTGSPQDSQTQVISKYTFLNSSHTHTYIYIYLNPLSSQSKKTITSQTSNIHTQTWDTNFRRVSPLNITPVERAHKARSCWYHQPF